MLEWNEQTIRWFSKAAKMNSFHSELAQELLPYINKDGSLFDLGCGLGFLSTELAPCVKEVTAVDISADAILALTHRCEEEKIANVNAVCTDWSTWQPEKKCHTLVMSFCGGLINHLEKLLSLTEKYLISILHWEQNSHSFNVLPYVDSPNPTHFRECIEMVVPLLTERGIPFTLKELSGEFGQPFDTFKDACKFIRFHYEMDSETKLHEYLTKNLIVSNSGYYLPNHKRSGLLVIDVQKL